MQKTVETERLVLRTLSGGDAESVRAYFDRNRVFLEPWEPEREEAFYTRERQRELLEAEQAEMDAGRMLRLWVFKKDKPHRVIGSVSFGCIVRGCFLSCFLGYRLDTRETGRGYMSEAVRKGVEVMFGEYGLHRIEANIIPRNAASLRVAEKAGFLPEGIARKYLKIHGVWEDHVHMVRMNDAI
jgi:ribosomal-protein-alanine N-acetyltransferase